MVETALVRYTPPPAETGPVRWVAGLCARRSCRAPFVVAVAAAYAGSGAGWPSTCSKACAKRLNRAKKRAGARRQQELARRVLERAKELACVACGEAAGRACRRLLCWTCWSSLRASCFGKYRYSEAAARNVARRFAGQEGTAVDAYWCPLSNAWHVGFRAQLRNVARIHAARQVLLTMLSAGELARVLEVWDPLVIDTPVPGLRVAQGTGAG